MSKAQVGLVAQVFECSCPQSHFVVPKEQYLIFLYYEEIFQNSKNIV